VAAPRAGQEITLPQTLNDGTPSGHDARALSVAVEVSTKSWVIGIPIPDTPHTVRIHTRAAGDAAGRVATIRKAPTDDGARILLTYEVGTKGFGRARWLHPNAPPSPS